MGVSYFFSDKFLLGCLDQGLQTMPYGILTVTKGASGTTPRAGRGLEKLTGQVSWVWGLLTTTITQLVSLLLVVNT